MQAAQKRKPDRSILLAWMARRDTKPNEADIAGLFRWFTTLRAGCVKRQLPVAMEVRHMLFLVLVIGAW